MIQISVDPRTAIGAISNASERQLPHAVRLALNRTANDAQASMRSGLSARFHLRRAKWNLDAIYISKQDRADKSTWRVIIQVQEKRSYLEKFEAGGFKVPMGGHSYLWEPNAKVFKNKIIPAGDPLRPKNLHMHLDTSGRMVGDQRTFMVRPRKGTGGSIEHLVIQRTGRDLTAGSKRKLKGLTLANVGKKGKTLERGAGTRTLYKLRKKIPIQAQLEFVSTIKASVDATFNMHMYQAMAEAMRSAK